MDYLLGSIVTLLTIAAVIFFVRRVASTNKIVYASYSQSQLHSLIFPLLYDEITMTIEPVTQASKHYDSMYTKILFIKNKAYWIKDNSFYVADLDEDGQVNPDSAKVVDTMAMNKVQLDEAMLIVEELTRGSGHDSRNTGKS